MLGVSSGAVLALDAAAALPGVTRVVACEPPLSDQPQDHVDAHVTDVEAHPVAGRNGAAVAAFLDDVGMPRQMLALLRLTPAWRKLTASAPTMPHDLPLIAECLRDGHQRRWGHRRRSRPGAGRRQEPQAMRAASADVARSVPTAGYQTLPGQTHMVKPKVLAPVTAAFLTGRDAQAASR